MRPRALMSKQETSCMNGMNPCPRSWFKATSLKLQIRQGQESCPFSHGIRTVLISIPFNGVIHIGWRRGHVGMVPLSFLYACKPI